MARVMRKKRRCDDDNFYCSCTKERGSNKKTLHSTARDHCVTSGNQRLHPSGAACSLVREHPAHATAISPRYMFTPVPRKHPAHADRSPPANGQAATVHAAPLEIFFCGASAESALAFFLFARIAMASTRSSSVRYCARCWIRFRLRLSFLRSAVNFFR